jgi:hypothetical protein
MFRIAAARPNTHWRPPSINVRAFGDDVGERAFAPHEIPRRARKAAIEPARNDGVPAMLEASAHRPPRARPGPFFRT